MWFTNNSRRLRMSEAVEHRAQAAASIEELAGADRTTINKRVGYVTGRQRATLHLLASLNRPKDDRPSTHEQFTMELQGLSMPLLQR